MGSFVLLASDGSSPAKLMTLVAPFILLSALVKVSNFCSDRRISACSSKHEACQARNNAAARRTGAIRITWIPIAVGQKLQVCMHGAYVHPRMKPLLPRGGFGCGLNANEVVVAVRDRCRFEFAAQGRRVDGIWNFVFGRSFGFDEQLQNCYICTSHDCRRVKTRRCSACKCRLAVPARAATIQG